MARRKDDTRTDDEAMGERLDALIAKDDGGDGCWHWRGYRQSVPPYYGRVWSGKWSRRAHLETLRLAGRTKADDEVWVRSCGSDDCVRPEHWQAKTRSQFGRDNPRIVEQRTRATCIHGHPWDAENTYRTPQGFRACRSCRRLVDQKRRRKTISTA